MIDIHTHIIPGVDDGAFSMEEALKILKVARADGTKAMVATPHVFSHVSRFSDLGEYRRRFFELKKKAVELHIGVEILPGAEVFFVSDLRDKLKTYKDLLTINGSDYFLLEFPPSVVFPGSREYIYNLVNDGFIPIICHPERSPVFQNDPLILYQLLQVGALSQIDAGSLRGSFGSSAYAAAIELLKLNMVHVIASDCHDPGNRSPGLSFLYKKLSSLGKHKIDMLLEGIPLAIVNNNAVPDIGPMVEPGKKTTFVDFLRGVLK